MTCSVCDDPRLDCPEHPDPEVWPNKNGWSIRHGQTYQGLAYWYLQGPNLVSFEAAQEELRRVSPDRGKTE